MTRPDDALVAVLERVVTQEAGTAGDVTHDLGHLRRVHRNACAIAKGEAAAGRPSGDPGVLAAAAYLHDLVAVEKDAPQRAAASRLSAERAAVLLRGMPFPADLIADVAHAIEAHSFSAGIAPRTADACILQDADRLEALGAIGIARCFAVAGRLNTTLFDDEDPLAAGRPLDDRRYALDHFETKLFRLPPLLRTATGRALAEDRVAVMRAFVRHLAAEIR